MLKLITFTVQSATLAPWFPPHLQRDIFLTLQHLEPEEGQEKPPVVPESILKAALLRRAVEDIQRIIQVRTAKQACGSLLQRGSVGDDLWQRFLRAEKEVEEELRDVVLEVRHTTLISKCIVLTLLRQTHSCQIGDRQSSNRPTKLMPIHNSAKDSKRSKARPRLKRSGGRNVERQYSRIS